MNIGKIQNNAAFASAMIQCSDNIQKFLRGLNGLEKCPVDFAFLDKLGCRQSDGSYFRVLSGLRSYEEQWSVYRQGRNVSFVTHQQIEKGVSPWRGRWYEVTKSEVRNKRDIATNCLPGASYHNYGLAVDIVLRKFGENRDCPNGRIPVSKQRTVNGVTYDTLKQVYKKAGILTWAVQCGLEWGGEWDDFLDLAHFQDSSYRPLPDKRGGDDGNLRNVNNCDFVHCRKYWESDVYDDGDRQGKGSASPLYGVLALLAVGAVVAVVVGKKKRK